MKFGESALKREKDQLFGELCAFGLVGRMCQFVHDPDKVCEAFGKAFFTFEIGSKPVHP